MKESDTLGGHNSSPCKDFTASQAPEQMLVGGFRKRFRAVINMLAAIYPPVCWKDSYLGSVVPMGGVSCRHKILSINDKNNIYPAQYST